MKQSSPTQPCLVVHRNEIISKALDNGIGFRRLDGCFVDGDEDGLFGLHDDSAVPRFLHYDGAVVC